MSVSCSKKIAALVPVFNESAVLKSFISRLREIGICEVIVADGGSQDNSFAIASEYADCAVECPQGRGRQIEYAAQQSSAEILWIIHCDCYPPANARTEILEILSDENTAMGAFPITFESSHPLLKLYGFLSRFDSAISTFGDQGYFLRSKDYRDIGGISELSLFEDVELRRRVRRNGKIVKSRVSLRTSARRFRKNGVFMQQIKNGYLLARYFAGANPEVLAKMYNAS